MSAKKSKSKQLTAALVIIIALTLSLATWFIFNSNSIVNPTRPTKTQELTINYDQLVGGNCNYFSKYPDRDLCIDDQDVAKIKADHPEWGDQASTIGNSSQNVIPVIVITAVTHTEVQKRTKSTNPPKTSDVTVTRLESVKSARLDSVSSNY